MTKDRSKTDTVLVSLEVPRELRDKYRDKCDNRGMKMRYPLLQAINDFIKHG